MESSAIVDLVGMTMDGNVPYDKIVAFMGADEEVVMEAHKNRKKSGPSNSDINPKLRGQLNHKGAVDSKSKSKGKCTKKGSNPVSKKGSGKNEKESNG